ncbi:MAG: UDP-N-acetylglucosamine 1-carboxyvinyltransferase [Calditrichaeota bacterium]|nr:UDP-N-acetylglucosamine 1-carboxyvinyltransferase [Calditrichota bacterium]MBT7617245.1 UDP-N-acetylglucosamine 1-carboxyvinyltransferase [Calditrichota bacterium]MBT7788508.1 UDP-N-acetylglucosamine 1-carboxyvinyltransferase [Calditrichota bacterium]
MDRFDVEGGRPLTGTIECAGSKNGTLPLMAASLLTKGVTILDNVPHLQDIFTMAMVMRVIGADVQLENGKLRIDTSHSNFFEAPYELVRKMRASFYVLGPLIARFGKAKVSLPGGCNLGPRPVNLHLKAFERLGCKIDIDAGYVLAETDNLKGAVIDLDIASVGATGNIMMAATAAEGTTTIHNAACEPEIEELGRFLTEMGADVSGAGTPTVEINGPTVLKPVSNWRVIPDRIEAGTLLVAGAITNGRVTVQNCNPEHLSVFLNKLADTGADVEISGNDVTVDATNRKLSAVDITTAVYPGFPTDLQSPWTSLMSVANGSSTLTEKVYPERFSHVPELERLGAKITKEMNSAHITGVDSLKAASIMCSDIRAAAAIVIAALAAEGQTSVLRVYHLDRGYERFEDKLNKLGGKVLRVRE